MQLKAQEQCKQNKRRQIFVPQEGFELRPECLNGRRQLVYIMYIKSYRTASMLIETVQLIQYIDHFTVWTTQESGFGSQQGQEFFFPSSVARLTLGPPDNSLYRILGTASLQIIRPGREAELSPEFSSKIKNAGDNFSTCPCVFMARYFSV